MSTAQALAVHAAAAAAAANRLNIAIKLPLMDAKERRSPILPFHDRAARRHRTVMERPYSCHNGDRHGGERASLQEVRRGTRIDPLARPGDGRPRRIADPPRA